MERALGSTSDLCGRLSGFRAECPESRGQSGASRPRLCQNSRDRFLPVNFSHVDAISGDISAPIRLLAILRGGRNEFSHSLGQFAPERSEPSRKCGDALTLDDVQQFQRRAAGSLLSDLPLLHSRDTGVQHRRKHCLTDAATGPDRPNLPRRKLLDRGQCQHMEETLQIAVTGRRRRSQRFPPMRPASEGPPPGLSRETVAGS
jgi:hypothetical protein